MFFVILLAVISQPLFSSMPWLIFVQDDFLYYLKVAQNIAAGHGSTFNGIVATNGYQPLWLYVLVGLSLFTTKAKFVLAFLAFSTFISSGATFALACKLLQKSGARPLLIFAAAGWTTLYSLTLFFYGMEVTLTVPLLLGVLCMLSNLAWITQHWSHASAFGLLLSAMVLSRIDTLIFGALLLAGILLSRELRRLIRPELLVGVGVGLLPVLPYFAFNHIFFHTWLPISGMAKELKSGHGPSLEPFRVFFHPLAGTFTLLILFAMILLPRVRSRFEPINRVFLPATLIFPFLYYTILSCVSDWTLWGWYMYPIRTAICCSFLIFLSWPPSARLLQQRIVVATLVVSVFVCLALVRWTHQQSDIYAASVEIQQFASGHPGVYAMGDRAGRVGYLIPDPVIQTEGLMMDRSYLRLVEQQLPLREVLAAYNVRYYIATAYEPFTGCFHASEPAKGGPSSAKLRDVFCEQPEAAFTHEGIQTLVFDLQMHQ